MDILETPNIYDRPGPNGTFVVVGLDPVASVAGMKDELATAAAAALPKHKYLAIIDTLGWQAGLELALGLPKLEYVFAGVGRGLPVEEWPAVAISPALPTREERPTLIPSAALPWSDCYVHTFESFDAVVSRIYTGSPSNIRLSDADMDVILEFTAYDGIRRGKEREAAAEAAGELDAENAAGAGSDGSDSQQGSEEDADSAGAVSSSGSSVSSVALPTGPTARTPFQPQRMDLHVEMWLDLTASHELSTPRQLRSDIRQLESIETEWAQRIAEAIVTKRPQTTAWLQGVATGDEPPEALSRPPSDDGMPDDVEVAPDDAIDVRVEKGRAERHARRAERPAAVEEGQLFPVEPQDESGPHGPIAASKNDAPTAFPTPDLELMRGPLRQESFFQRVFRRFRTALGRISATLRRFLGSGSLSKSRPKDH
ncbi:hypothetical protein EXIGLDRAFT_174663 [Exidia glandulosa HHB12029]|uniref:Uncharacterized protein n=1 Tax=Exidia glandulosa HHB12029 TaxID=1314781 RepID=A0A165F7H5_EXIGL|nr:hypothetical protein EXIGLDRAFT_174663 [Exidia glandulosa HHB12029]